MNCGSSQDSRHAIYEPMTTTYTADQTLRILVHRPVFRELKLILEHPVVHVRVVFCPEWCLR